MLNLNKYIIISLLLLHPLTSEEHPIDDVVDLGHCEALDRLRVGHGHVGSGDSVHWCIEPVEGLRLHDNASNLSTDTTLRPSLLNGDYPLGLLDRLDDSLTIDWAQRPQIDHLHIYVVVLLQLLSCL